MEIFKPHVVEVDVRSTELTTLSDTRRSRLITSINLLCQGELKAGTTVEFEIQTTQQEREMLTHIFDSALERFKLENNNG